MTMMLVAPLPVHQILTDRTDLSALSWSLFYILDLPAHLAWAGLGGLVSSCRPESRHRHINARAGRGTPTANQRPGTGDQ